ncbi:MAG: ABC transporter ATP-binding protein [Flavobacteriales bacterium]|nr:ABC transporter ATP-binding protein [Flavobacteriales bacterium]
MRQPILQIQNLSIGFGSENQYRTVLHEINWELFSNEILGIVGESGSGKSVGCFAIAGLLPAKNARITQGKILLEGIDLYAQTEKEWQQLRGKHIGMVFQEPMSALNPSMTCGRQIEEVLAQHTQLAKTEIKNKVLQLLEQVKLHYPERIYQSYPHQISGGQKQRVVIAMAIACEPKILIADEPTTALDVTVQREILDLLVEIKNKMGMSIVFISHDLSLVANFSDRVLIMQHGKIVEQGVTQQVFQHPKEIYTKALLASKPNPNERLKRLPTIQDFLNNTPLKVAISKEERKERLQAMEQQTPLLEIKNVEKTYWSQVGFFGKKQAYQAVNDVSLKIYEGETLGLVGESGCGKSTLGNLILKLDQPQKGAIFYQGTDITHLSNDAFRQLRKQIQVIFQDPFASLNPKLTVGKAILEPMQVHGILSNTQERKDFVIELLQKVGLQAEHFNRYPHEFSGGQRQRIGIARSIALQPKLVVCDESVSALDISVQAQVLNLLNDLKDDYQFTYLFISHDLQVVKYMSDHVAVMQQGKIVEYNEADALYEQPQHPYTQKLLQAIP